MKSELLKSLTATSLNNPLRGGSLSEVIRNNDTVLKIYRGKHERGYEKLRKEVDFITSVPEKVKKYYPTIIDVVDEEGLFGYTMPYYHGLKSMSDFLMSGHDLDFIWDMLNEVANFMDSEHYLCTTDILDSDHVNEVVHTRLVQAVESLEKHNELKEILNGSFKKDGSTLLPIEKIKANLLKDTFTNTKMIPKKADYIHGNFHLDNILISENSFMLIDPRGESRGTKLYDVCKMFVHLLIRYDEIHTNRFNFSIEDTVIRIRMLDNTIGRRYDFIQNKYLDKVIASFDQEYFLKCLQVIGGVHAVSFSSYHARKDNVCMERVKAYLVGGMLLLTDYIQGETTDLRKPLFSYKEDA